MNRVGLGWWFFGLVAIPTAVAIFYLFSLHPQNSKQQLSVHSVIPNGQEWDQLPRPFVTRERQADQGTSKETEHVSLAAPGKRPYPRAQAFEDVDEEIAYFEKNRIKLEDSDAVFENERQNDLLDESYAQSVRKELAALHAGLPFPSESRVFCTRSFCEVHWTSDEPLETLIPHLTPWLLAQTDFAVDDGRRDASSGTDFSLGLRIVIPRG